MGSLIRILSHLGKRLELCWWWNVWGNGK